jgi:hypothetical protein
MPNETHAVARLAARKRTRPAIALVTIVAAAVLLAACGGSSKSPTVTSASATKPSAARFGRFKILRTCLQKQGINLPSTPAVGGGQPGSGAPPSGRPPGARAGFKLPAGTSQTKFREAIKKCGGSNFPGGARRGLDRTTLARYSQCMRENGVKLPPANTNGNGPVFNTKGIDTASAAFKSARTKCQSALKGAFGGGRPPASGQGVPPPEGGAGSPPSGEGAG